MTQDDVNELVAGIVAFVCNAVKLGQSFLPQAYSYNSGSVLTAFFYFQGFIFHSITSQSVVIIH